MPGALCSVSICKSNFNKSKQLGETIRFFSFPSDEKLREEWVRRCHREDTFHPKNKRICHKHFMVDDFEDSVKAQLMNRPARRLKKCAVPSLHLQDSEKIALSSRADRMLQKQQKATVKKALPNTSEIKKECSFLNLSPSISEDENAFNELLKKFNALMEENLQLKRQVAENAVCIQL